MAFKLNSRVLETFVTTGTGTITLGGALIGYKTFASEMSNADTCFYIMEGGSDFEIGYGTYSANTLARTAVLRSSNSNNAVNWGAGTKTVGIYPLGPSEWRPADIIRMQGLFGLKFNGLIHGLTLSNNASDATNDIDIASGVAADSTGAAFLTLASGITKRLDAAWAVGSGNGGLDTGSIANATYHMWLIMRSDTGVVDVLFSTSATSPTMPANYNYRRRIGSIVRTGGAIKGFTQDGDRFTWKTGVQDVNATNPGAAAVTRTLTVPTGINVIADLFVRLAQAATTDTPGTVALTDLESTNAAADATNGSLYWFQNVTGGTFISGGSVMVRTNTSGQIRSRLEASSTNTLLTIGTKGWIDRRGKDR